MTSTTASTTPPTPITPTKGIAGRALHSVLGNSQRLDGGSMFGNAPRALWQRWIEPDERHRIPLACRCLLVREEGRTILFEAGIGAFFEPSLRDRFGVQEPEHRLLENLGALGVAPEDVDVIVLSHLHFDHAGGVLSAYAEGAPLELVFPNASYVVGDRAFERALAPHARDRASFIPELQPLLEATGRLERVRDGADGEVSFSTTLGPAYPLHFADGHTPGLMMAEIPTQAGPMVYASDLIPGAPWVHLPISMGYDRYPERLIDEKRALLSGLLERQGGLFFVHDPTVACAQVARDERGRFHAAQPKQVLQEE